LFNALLFYLALFFCVLCKSGGAYYAGVFAKGGKTFFWKK
jgi:hypothetical protein